MNRYLIDTNIISEIRKGDRANRGVREWFEQNAGSDMWLSVLVVGELQRSVELIGLRDPVAAHSLAEWVQTIVDGYADQVLDVDLEVAMTWARFDVLDPIPIIDGLLAATALTHDLVLVTRNESDVASTGVQILNPFNITRAEVHPGPFVRFIDGFLASPAASADEHTASEITRFLDLLDYMGSEAIIAPLAGPDVAEMSAEISRVLEAGGDWLDACDPEHLAPLLIMSQVEYALGEGIEFEHDRLDGYRAAFTSLCTWGVGQGYLNEDQRKEVLHMLADFPIED